MSKKITIRLGSRLITRRWLWFARTGYVIYGYELWRPGHEHIVYARDHNNVVSVLQSWKNDFLKCYDFTVHPELPSEIDALPFVSDGSFIMADEWNAVRNVLIKIADELKNLDLVSKDPNALMYVRRLNYIDEAFPGGYVSSWEWNMRRMAILDLVRTKIGFKYPPEYPPTKDVYVFNTDDWYSAKPYITDGTVLFIRPDIPNVGSDEIWDILGNYIVKILVTVDTQPYRQTSVTAFKGILYSVDRYSKTSGQDLCYIVSDKDQSHFGSSTVEGNFDFPVQDTDHVAKAIQWTKAYDDPRRGHFFVKICGRYVAEVQCDGFWKDVSWLDKYITWLPSGYPDTFKVYRIVHIASDTTDRPSWHQYPTLSQTLQEWAKQNGFAYHDMR